MDTILMQSSVITEFLSLKVSTAMCRTVLHLTEMSQWDQILCKFAYRISSYSFRGNYSFLNSTLCSVTFGHSKYRCGNYSRVETIRGITVSVYFSISEWWNWPKHQFCQVPNGIFGIIVTGTKFFFTHMPGYNGNICTYFLIWK